MSYLKETEEQKQQRLDFAIDCLELKGDPFVPEELGFTETVQYNNDGSIEARIYSRDGFNIARPVDLDTRYWVVMGPDLKPKEVLLLDMYNAIIVLQACGMMITFEDYFDKGEYNEDLDGLLEKMEESNDEEE